MNFEFEEKIKESDEKSCEKALGKERSTPHGIIIGGVNYRGVFSF